MRINLTTSFDEVGNNDNDNVMPAAGAAPAAWTVHGRFRPNPNSPGCLQPRAPGSSSSRLGYPGANDVANGSSDHGSHPPRLLPHLPQASSDLLTHSPFPLSSSPSETCTEGMFGNGATVEITVG